MTAKNVQKPDLFATGFQHFLNFSIFWISSVQIYVSHSILRSNYVAEMGRVQSYKFYFEQQMSKYSNAFHRHLNILLFCTKVKSVYLEICISSMDFRYSLTMSEDINKKLNFRHPDFRHLPYTEWTNGLDDQSFFLPENLQRLNFWHRR